MAQDKEIQLNVNGTDLTFNVNLSNYNKYINGAMKPTANGVQLATNFLTNVVSDQSKPDLMEIIKQPGAAINIIGHVIEDYQPDFEITVKK
jgi:hypothetical protein